MNHLCILYQQDKIVKNKLEPIDIHFIKNAIQAYIRKLGKEPNRIYGSVLIDKDFGIEYIINEKIKPYLLYVGHTEDIDKIHDDLSTV